MALVDEQRAAEVQPSATKLFRLIIKVPLNDSDALAEADGFVDFIGAGTALDSETAQTASALRLQLRDWLGGNFPATNPSAIQSSKRKLAMRQRSPLKLVRVGVLYEIQ